jgi:hypothetical protein
MNVNRSEELAIKMASKLLVNQNSTIADISKRWFKVDKQYQSSKI